MTKHIRIDGRMIDVDRSLFEIMRADAEDSLAEFVKQAWHVIEPGQDYVHGWHIDFICAHLEAITDGVELEGGEVYNRLLINVPPGAMKSLLTSVFWPAWWWGPRNEPHKRFLCASHSQSLAIRDSTKMRRLITSHWYRERWGDRVILTGDQNAKTKFETTATGFREAVAAGSITGSRGDVVIIDDPHSVESAASDAMRQSTIEWFTEAVPTRLNNPKRSAIVVIMQRLHEEDVSGVIVSRKLGYDHIMLPMRYDPGRAKTTMLGVDDPREEEGELLFPARFPEEVVDRDERVMGPYACNTGEAPVLMADLSLKRIDEVRAGDEVLGWVRDEGGRSRMVRTRVKQTFQYSGAVVKMTLDSGEIIRCTPDHKWWRARWEKGRNEYAPAKVGTSLARVCPANLPELSADDLRLAGWLSGFFDGEGSVSVCKKNGSGDYRPSQQIHFYQGSGRNLPLCEKLEQALTHFGFSFRYQEDDRKPNKDAPCYGYRTYNLISGQQSLGLAQRFMHIVQPTKWRGRIEDMALGAKFVQGWEKVVSIEPDGEEPVYALETETGNYVVWGLCSSNSAGQFQQNPEPRGGGIIKRAWWQRWDKPTYPPFDYIVAAVDTAYTEKEENDPSAMTVWGVFSGGDQVARITRSVNRHDEAMQMAERAYSTEHPRAMLIYAWTERLELHDLVERIRETVGDWGVDHLLIEDKAAGHSVAQELRRIYGYDDFGVQLVNPGKADKVARLYSVQHLFADGLVYAPMKTWAETVINQIAQFPKGKHDDLVDTASMAMKFLRESGMLVRANEHTAELDASRSLGQKHEPLYPV